MARVEALSSLNTINSTEAEQVESSFARGWEPAGYSHRHAVRILERGEAVFQTTDLRAKLGGAWGRLLWACLCGGLIAGGLLLAGGFWLGRNW